MTRSWYIALFLFMLGTTAMAQPGRQPAIRETMEALKHANEGQLDSAVLHIEKAVASERGKSDAWTWVIRGYVYKAVYKANEKDDKASAARETALESYYTALRLDQDNEYVDNTHQGVNYLANSYYNDAVVTLNVNEYTTSLKCYESYKKAVVQIDPEKDFSDQDVQYHNVLGSSVYSILAERESDSKKKNDYINEAIKVYDKVLTIDEFNFSANYNTAVLFYNQGVNKIKEIDPLAPFDSVIARQDQSVELFKRSKPYMHRANYIDPCKREVYIGLSGIYFSLQLVDSSNFYTKRLEQLDATGCNFEEERMKLFEPLFAPFAEWVDTNGALPSASSTDETEQKMYAQMELFLNEYAGEHMIPQQTQRLEALPGWQWK